VGAFELLIAGVGVLAGAVAAIAGFGVGSLLTPVLIPSVGAKLAIAIVSVPHAIATLLRLWRLRQDIAWPVLKSFGIASAAGGLAGAYVFTLTASSVLTQLLAALLIFVGAAELTGFGERFRLSGVWSWVAGALSGVFGGMVGNQGGIRSAGLLAFDLPPRAFVATAAASALIVDAVRVPLYIWHEGASLAAHAGTVVVATGGVVIGTFAGSSVLMRLPRAVFRRVVGAVLLTLGVWMLA